MNPRDPNAPSDPALDRSADGSAEEEDESLGFFRSWRSLYATVIVYTVGLIILLYVLTRALDHSVT